MMRSLVNCRLGRLKGENPDGNMIQGDRCWGIGTESQHRMILHQQVLDGRGKMTRWALPAACRFPTVVTQIGLVMAFGSREGTGNGDFWEVWPVRAFALERSPIGLKHNLDLVSFANPRP